MKSSLLLLAAMFCAEHAAVAGGYVSLHGCERTLPDSALLHKIDNKMNEISSLTKIAQDDVAKIDGQSQPDSFCQAAQAAILGTDKAYTDLGNLEAKAGNALSTLTSANDPCLKVMEQKTGPLAQGMRQSVQSYEAHQACARYPVSYHRVGSFWNGPEN